MTFGERLWICPTGHELDPTGKVVVHLDPGLAFGSGTHETTRLCLEWLDGAALGAKTLIDYGCGSGVLAVAAALLGARDVRAVDLDPQAITATERNAARNGAEVTCGLVGELALPQADVVIANLLAQPLVELAPELCRLTRPGGDLVLSGVMADQASWVSRAYEAFANLERTQARGEWVRLDYRVR